LANCPIKTKSGITVKLYAVPVLKASIPSMEKLDSKEHRRVNPKNPTIAIQKPICMRRARRKNRKKMPIMPTPIGLMI
jgi:hypothetical protein